MNVSAIWRLSWVLVVCTTSAGFSATNVCSKLKNYTVTSMETYTEPVIVNTFTWCLQIPPRCPKTRTEMRQRYRMKTETKTKTVDECCEGYKMISTVDGTGPRCVPHCEKCVSGVCVSPNLCQCIPGYKGKNCETACQPGTWGPQCKEKCDCTEDVPCNPVNGHCVCPPGLRGQTCNQSCPDDRWGPECGFSCDCTNSEGNKCDPETGRCTDYGESSTEGRPGTTVRDSNEETGPVVNVTVVESDDDATRAWQTTEIATNDVARSRDVFEAIDNSSDNNASTSTETIATSTTDRPWTKIEVRKEIGSSTIRPAIVLVSVPERRRNLENDRGTFVVQNPFLRHVDDNVKLRRVVQSKTEYVDTVHKEDQPATIPLGIALIVVASVVSLGLTSVAVVMVLHMRSKLLETTRISIYEEGKPGSQENSNATRISAIVTGTLPRTSARLGPLFTSTLDSRTVIPNDCMELSNNYANSVATLRLSDNLRGLVQDDHYDRPPATRIHLRNEFDANTEHVYDEIPLQSSPLTSHKDE